MKITSLKPQTSNLDNIATITPSRADVNASKEAMKAMADALSAYQRQIYILAKRNWKIPTISVDGLEAKVSFTVSASGKISGVKIIESSGDEAFDKSVTAVFNSITIPPPPDNEAHAVTILFRAN